MNDTQLHALNLLLVRLITVGTLLWVIINLRRQFKTTYTKYNSTRIAIITLIGVALFGTPLPIIFDLARFFGRDSESLLIPYAYSNAITGATSGIGWVVLYKTSRADSVKTKVEHDELVADNKALTQDNKVLRR